MEAIGIIYGLYRGQYWDNGKENGSCQKWGYIGVIGYILRLHWDNGKENGKYRVL